MNLKILNIEHCDEFFNNEYLCWVIVGDVPEQFVNQAKEIDGENFSESCFGIRVGKDDEGWYISADNPYCQLYYIDNEGDEHWFEYLLNETEREEAFRLCNYMLNEKGGNTHGI